MPLVDGRVEGLKGAWEERRESRSSSVKVRGGEGEGEGEGEGDEVLAEGVGFFLTAIGWLVGGGLLLKVVLLLAAADKENVRVVTGGYEVISGGGELLSVRQRDENRAEWTE